jgi:hypothetical protein
MNCETGFLHSVGFWSVPVCRCVEDPRGARDWAHLRATDLYSVGSLGPDHDAVMRIGGKLRGGGPPILLSRHRCHVRIRRPATSDCQSAVG